GRHHPSFCRQPPPYLAPRRRPGRPGVSHGAWARPRREPRRGAGRAADAQSSRPRGLLDRDIVAGAAVEDVAAGAADQDIIAVAAAERVIAVAADQDVVAVATFLDQTDRRRREARRLDHVVAALGADRQAVVRRLGPRVVDPG